MKIAYLDTVGGIAGNMALAAFVHAGMPFDQLLAELEKLSLKGFRLALTLVKRNSIGASHIDVQITDPPSYHRHLPDILSLIDKSTISEGAKERARRIFQVIAAAEARVHTTSVEKIHFHEVGALDSIVDIVGTSICLDALGIEAVYSSPVKLGSGGMISTQHGSMPIPAPATVEILRDYPVLLTTVPRELTTPTGAAIIKALSQGTLAEQAFRPTAVGYGAGTGEFPELPNLLRVVLGEMDSALHEDESFVVETNIDDMNPQVYPYLIEQLLLAGAHDAYLVPVVMKKGRPGVLLSVLADPAALEKITACIYRETTTIGLRIHTVGRKKLPRAAVEVVTSLGPVKVKSVVRDGKTVLGAEFEECRRIAVERRLPLITVMKRLEQELSAIERITE
jgi:uncharacterized protein (TIGR00299 family) protein